MNEKEFDQFSAFYGPHYPYMQEVLDKTMDIVQCAAYLPSYAGNVHVISRIKTPESMSQKIIEDGLPVTYASALQEESDAIGIRVITDSISSVYAYYDTFVRVLSAAGAKPGCYRILYTKDYIKEPKDSGYRSLHVILGVPSRDPDFSELKVELQIRTSIMDCWASLEHLVKYKQQTELTPELLDALELYRKAADMELQKWK